MQRILIVYNPRSSRFSDVRAEVLEPAGRLYGFMIGKFEVSKTDIEDNIDRLAKLIVDGDIVVSAGGDATGIITVNAAIKSRKDVAVAVLPYGNFNDLSRTLGLSTIGEAIEAKTREFYPLGIYVDGEFWRWATCYVTIGMTAEAVKLYDSPAMRKRLRSSFGRKVISYTALARWYFRNRKKKQFMPECRLNGVLQASRTSDYAAVNGRYMARVMKGRDDFLDPERFRSVTDQLGSFWRLFSLMARSVVNRVPGKDTDGDTIEFLKPSTVEIQAEGESRVFKNAKKIEIRKMGKSFQALGKF